MSNEMIGIGESETKEEKSSGINWGRVVDLDRTESGLANVDATMERLRIELELFVERQEVPLSVIAEATDKAFAKAVSKSTTGSLKMASLTSRALLEMDIDLSAETRIGKRIVDYVQSESQRFIESGGVSGEWLVRLGRDGGVFRATDDLRAKYATKTAK
jgi:hypothetical protein